VTQARYSLEKRLMRRLLLILGASFLVFTVVYLFFIKNDSVFHASEAVGELARDLAPRIERQPDGSYAFRPMRGGVAPDYIFAAIETATGRPVRGSDAALLPDLQGRPISEVSSSRVLKMKGGLLVLGKIGITVDGTNFLAAAQRPMTFSSIAAIGLTHEFAEEILPCFLPSLLLAALVTWVTIRSSLRPLRRASREASAVSVDNPGQRMGTDNLAVELVPLIDTVNTALGHLEDALSAQKRFTANAAHELRTPLAVLQARADGLPQSPARVALLRDIRRMSRAVSQMLLASRLQARAAGELAFIDLAATVRNVIADLAPLAHSQNLDIALEVVGRTHLLASEGAIESATRNLIENALRFTPAHETVTVQVGPGAQVIVEDCGPGISDRDKQSIFEPFWRAPGQKGEGSGLGLAIVHEVATLHAGSVRVEDASSGGARFVLQFGRQGAAMHRPAGAPPAELMKPSLAAQ
jgi:two-component system OmpR family sensor kinase